MKSEKIEICGPGFRYDALIGRGLLARAGDLVRSLVQGKGVAVIADENSARLFAAEVCQSLSGANYRPALMTVAPGEKSKSLAQVERLCCEMSTAGMDRTSWVLGLGGGVIGDLSGFAAAVFHRGIPHVQIPTTLLAMVDSAIGGKTGVNLPEGKNLVGAIHHPALVLADIDALKTLPLTGVREGFAEIIKHAIIADAEMMMQLSHLRSSEAANWKLAPLIRWNIAIKAKIVSADAREISGERALLNFGHTIGHAIERAADFRISHGECVSLGIVAECEISIRGAGLIDAERDRVLALLQQFELPIRLPADISRERIMDAVQRDKKFVDGRIRFVVTPRLGQARVTDDVTMQDIRDAIARL